MFPIKTEHNEPEDVEGVSDLQKRKETTDLHKLPNCSQLHFHLVDSIQKLNPAQAYTQTLSSSSANTKVPTTLAEPARQKRPFKAYHKKPLLFTFGKSTTETLINQASNEAYINFRQEMMMHLKSDMNVSTPRTRCFFETDVAKYNKHPTYWEKRKKNNEAAKRSRIARKVKEDEVAVRVAFLEVENTKLKLELDYLKAEIIKLYYLLK